MYKRQFYDRQLIAMVAKESGFSVDFVEETGEYATKSLLFSIATGSYYGQNAFTPDSMHPADKIHVLQNKIIRQIAEKEPCVIVGRCADYILKERTDCMHVFIHADMAFKKQRAMAEYGIAVKDVEKALQKKDKGRANHYKHYTQQSWGFAGNYNLTLDSGMFGLEACRDIIVTLAKRF